MMMLKTLIVNLLTAAGPTEYSHIHGCNHRQIMTSKQISEPIETRYDAATGRM